jgi:hypothetical protein
MFFDSGQIAASCTFLRNVAAAGSGAEGRVCPQLNLLGEELIYLP